VDKKRGNQGEVDDEGIERRGRMRSGGEGNGGGREMEESVEVSGAGVLSSMDRKSWGKVGELGWRYLSKCELGILVIQDAYFESVWRI
jgi:hypothetical protein